MGAGALLLHDCPSVGRGQVSLGLQEEARPFHRQANTRGPGYPPRHGAHLLATRLPRPIWPWWWLLVARCLGRWWCFLRAGGRRVAAGRGASSFMQRQMVLGGQGPGGGAGASRSPRSGGKPRPGAVSWPQSGPDSPQKEHVEFSSVL